MPTYSDALLSGCQPAKTTRDGKAYCIVASHTTFNSVVGANGAERPLYPLEEERLLGFPDGYTVVDGKVDAPFRHAMLGNSFSVLVATQLLALLRPLGKAVVAATVRSFWAWLVCRLVGWLVAFVSFRLIVCLIWLLACYARRGCASHRQLFSVSLAATVVFLKPRCRAARGARAPS